MTTSSLSPEAIIFILIMGFIIALMFRQRPPTVVVMQPPPMPAEGAGCVTTMIIGCVFILAIILLASVT